MKRELWLAVVLAAVTCARSPSTKPPEPTLYVHTYKGQMFAFRIDGVSGGPKWVEGSPYQVTRGPFVSLAFHPSHRYLYGMIGAWVRAFEREHTGEVTLVAEEEVSFRARSTVSNLVVHPNGRYLYVVTRSGVEPATISVLALAEDGPQLEQHPGVRIGLDAWSGVIHPGGEFLYCISGDGQSVVRWSIDEEDGSLSEEGMPASVRPRAHTLLFHPSGDFLYVLSRDYDSFISVYKCLEFSGALIPVGVAPTQIGGIVRDIAVTPDGKFLYAAVEAGNRILGYTITETGAPRLPPTGSRAGDGPARIVIEPTGNFLYVLNEQSHDIDGFLVKEDGALVPVSHTALPTGTMIEGAVVTPLSSER